MTFTDILPSCNYRKIYILLALAIIFEILILLFAFTSNSFSSFVIYFISVACVLFFILITTQNIFAGILILVLLVPFLNLTLKKLAISINSFTIAPISGMIWIIVIIFLGGFLIKKDISKQCSYVSVDIVLILLVIVAFFSQLSAYYIDTPLDRSSLVYITGVIEPALFYFLLRKILISEKMIRRILLAIVLLMGIGCVIGFFFMLTTKSNLLLFVTTRGGSKGFGFRGINLFGIAAVLVFPLTLLLTIHGEKKIDQIVSTAIRFMIFVAITASFTRGLQIAFLAELLLLLFFYGRGRRYLYPILIIILIAVVTFGEKLLILFIRFFESGPTTAAVSTIARLEAWKVSIEVLWKYPFGLGGGNFDYVWEHLRPTFLHTIPMGASHNIFLSVGTEYGVLSMILFVFVFLFQFKMCWWIFKNSKSKLCRDTAFLIGISYIGYCVYGVTTGCELSHIIRYSPLTIINTFTIILFTFFAVITTIFVKTKKEYIG